MVRDVDACVHAGNMQKLIVSLLIYHSSQQEGSSIGAPTGQGCITPGWSTALDCQDCSSAASQVLYKSKGGHLWEDEPAPLLEKHAEFYRLQELVMHRLHTVNSFTVMEIPNAVWPWKLIGSPSKGLSSEFPALAFSYHLSQCFRVHLCKAAGLEGGGQEGRTSPRVMHSMHFSFVTALQFAFGFNARPPPIKQILCYVRA